MVTVTEPPAGIDPFQVTVSFGRSAKANPEVAEAPTRVSPAGSTSTNSSPGLSACAAGPELASTTV